MVDPVPGAVDIARAAASGVSELLDLAILDLQGVHGLINLGVYQPDKLLLVEASGVGASFPASRPRRSRELLSPFSSYRRACRAILRPDCEGWLGVKLQ